MPTKDHGSSIRTTIHQSVCCVTLMPGSPSVSSKKNPLKVKRNLHGARSTYCHAAFWCRAFREPPRLERGKPETVTSASESSCLLSRKLFKVPRRAFRHEKKCCRHWKHLCQWPRSATKPFVNIPARACVRFRSDGHAFEAIGSSGGRVVEECVIPRHRRRSRRHKQRLRRRAGLPTPSNSVEAPSLTTSCHDRSLDGAWTQSGTNTSGAAVSATPGTRKNYVAAIEKLSALPATGVGITFTQTRTSIVRWFFMRTSCSTPS